VRGSLSIGNNHLKIEKTPQSDMLDFMNYNIGNNQNIYVNLSVLFELKKNFDISLQTDMGSNLKPYNFTLKAFYTPLKYMGVLGGYCNDKVYFKDYGAFHKLKNPDYNVNGRDYYENTLHSNNLFAGVFFPVSYNRLNAKIAFTGGLNFTNSIKIPIFEKKINGNEIRKYEYNISSDNTWFVQPSIEFTYDCFTIGNSTLGILGNLNHTLMQKSLDYERTQFKWTYQNRETIFTDFKKHNVNHLKWDIGVFVKW
jgi:hypothetical protein